MLKQWLTRLRFLLAPKPHHEIDEESQFHLEERVRVLQTASVLSIVSFAGVPCPVEASQLEALRAIVGSGLPYSPWPFLRAGQRVEICGGPLKGVEGILAREKSECRVVVNLELLQRAVAVEVERDLVRPCAQHRPATTAGAGRAHPPAQSQAP